MCVDHICKSSEYIFKAPEKLKKKKVEKCSPARSFLDEHETICQENRAAKSKQEKIFHVNR